METILKIEIGKINSKKFEKALNIMKSFPHYESEIQNRKEIHKCYIKDTIEYINNYTKVEPLISLVRNWKSASIYLNDKKMGKYLIYFRDFQYEMDRRAKKLINYEYKPSVPENVAMNNLSLDEGLKYRIVYYPPIQKPFFAYGNNLNERPFFCSCQKKAITNYVKVTSKLNSIEAKENLEIYFPTKVVQWCENSTKELLEKFKCEEKICHKCTGTVPKYRYIHPMYDGEFMQRFGWFVKMKFWEYGINYHHEKPSLIKELKFECPPEIYTRINKSEDIKEEIENIVRVELGYPRKGEQWINETLMFNILESMFPNYTIHRHHRPRWLEGLELDAYIPDKKLAFEYNGRQHYEAVEFFGGEERLFIQQENDLKKAKICKEKGISLITIKYDEDLSSNLIKSKIKLL